MARYDVHLNPEGHGWLLDVQAEELSSFNSRLVVPLIEREPASPLINRLNPVFVTEQGEIVMLTQFLLAVPRSVLKRVMFSLADRQDDIKRALDLAFYGF